MWRAWPERGLVREKLVEYFIHRFRDSGHSSMKAGNGKFLHSLLFREITTFVGILFLVGVPFVYVYLWDIERTLEEKFASQLELIAKQGVERLSAIEIAALQSSAWTRMPQYLRLISSLKSIEQDFAVDNAVVYRRHSDGRFGYIGDGNNQFKINQPVGLHQKFPKTFQAANEAWDSGLLGKTRLFQSGNTKWFQVNIPIKLKGEVTALLMLNKFATPIAIEIGNRQTRILMSAALILVLCLGLRWYLTRLQLRPLLALQHTVREIAKGNLAISPPDTKDKSEIGDLTRDFQKMTSDLRAGQEKIAEYHRTLEQRIEERTREIRELTRSKVQHLERQEAIGRLSGGIAHDFNNILTPIICYTEMVLSRLPPDGREADNLERVLEAALRARNLIARILRFSRPSKKIKRPVRMDEVTKEVLTLMRSTLSRSIEIIEEIDPKIGLVDADVTEIYTALMNLCVNASHAMPDGGELRVGLKEIQLDGQETPDGAHVTGSYVRLVLTDTGRGMPAAVMAKIYEPFFTTKAESQGTGLGLPTVREIVENHGGFIEVSSTEGVGTEFRLFFPLGEQEVEESKPARPISTEGDESILFVEDQASIRDMGGMLLEEMGYRVTLAKDSREALDIFQAGETKFDLVIAGQGSPHMTGNRLAEELKRISPDFPFILTAATPDPEKKETQDGVVNYVLPKPYSRDSLGQAVKKVLHWDG